jgi:hypothetical protein
MILDQLVSGSSIGFGMLSVGFGLLSIDFNLLSIGFELLSIEARQTPL